MADITGVILASGFDIRMNSQMPKHLSTIEISRASLRTTILGRLVDQMQNQRFSKVLILARKDPAMEEWLKKYKAEFKIPVELVFQQKAYDWKRNFEAIAKKLEANEIAVIVPGDLVMEEKNLKIARKTKPRDKPFLRLVFGRRRDKRLGKIFPIYNVSCWVTNKKAILAASEINPEGYWNALKLIPKIKRISFALGRPISNVNTPEILSKTTGYVVQRKIKP